MSLNAYWDPIKTALILFPLIAALFTLPYVIVQYRRYGALLGFRIFIVYSFILYLMCALFLAVLPLPDPEKVRSMTGPVVQLVPFQAILDIGKTKGFDISSPGTYALALRSPALFQIAANLIMFVPLGAYLKYYFRCSLKKTALLGFCFSLFIEITQLTGDFFLYPRPYRLFDVDDLMINTLGACAGYLLGALGARVLPSVEAMDRKSYKKGTRPSLTRRCLAYLIDWTLILLIVAILPVHIDREPGRFVVIVLWFVLIPTLSRGYTPGKWVVKLRVVTDGGSVPSLPRYALRYLSLYYIFLPSASYALDAFVLAGSEPGLHMILSYCISALCFAVFAAFLYCVALYGFTHQSHLPHDKLSRTVNQSTVALPSRRRKARQFTKA
ncbi:VanZ family protein [Beduinella massiliensis]|uniref:VanZ family protein n=1 Tax=Beduinella massiliensis TaxID=1852363 RepID=UPI0031F8824B